MQENPSELRKEIISHYGLSESNINVATNGELVFDFEGLQIMVNQLCPALLSDELNIRPFEQNQQYFYVDSILELANGRSVKRTGVAMMGEELGDEVISSAQQAISIASARAYRQSLRAISFDPVRAHRQAIKGDHFKPEIETDRADKLRRELHALGGELGYIKGADRSGWVELIRVMYSPRTSTTELDEKELLQLVTSLRASVRARSRAAEIKAA